MENNCFVVTTQSTIILNLAKKMRKTEKATYLQVKRIFCEMVGNRETTVNPSKENDNLTENPEGVEHSGKRRRKCRKGEENSENSPLSENSTQSESPTKFSETITRTFEIDDGSIFEIVTSKSKMRNKMVDKLAVKSGWSSKLAHFLFTHIKLQCKFDFKNIWVTSDETIHTSGKCECNCEVLITYCCGRLCVNAKNISKDFKHKRSYQIRGEFKKHLLNDLEHKGAQATRMGVVNEFISDNTNLNTNFNPLIGKPNAFRIIKHRAHQQSAQPIDVLLKWKDAKYRNVTSAVGHSPFFVFYRSELQLAWYAVESKKRPICISMDATGSVIIPPARSQKKDGSEELKHVFFYTIMAKTSGKSVPIAQMISQDQSSEFIAGQQK